MPRVKRRCPRAVRYLFGVIAAVFTVLYLFNAWAPEISPDGSSYHLGLVGAVFARSRIRAGAPPICCSTLQRGRGNVVRSRLRHRPAFRCGA